MTAFIVISTTESLNWIVDDIERCRPQNPAVETHIEIGKLHLKDDGMYYHYTYGAHATQTEEGGSDLYALLANQIANFRLRAQLAGGIVQIFMLENPISAVDIDRAKLVYDELQKVIVEKKYENNCHITRVVFSYDVNSLDVTRQVNQQYLQSLFNNQISNPNDDNLAHILYLDNQDRNGASIASTKEEHDLLVPRMLCDFMMLYSSVDSAYNVRNAAHGTETQVFSIGYAECMYYFKDIERFYTLAYDKDIRQYYLTCPNEGLKELDYEQYPLGLQERKHLLVTRYMDVPYTDDINDYQESVDKEIDDIVVSVRDQVVFIKEKALEDARLLDEQETEEKRNKALANDEDPELVLPVTRHTNEANNHFPDYIDRRAIYNLSLVYQPQEENTIDDVVYAAVSRYEKLIKFIQTVEFKEFILNPPTESNESSNIAEASVDTTNNKGCNWFARLFHKSEDSPLPQMAVNNDVCSPKDIIKRINSIATLQKEKEKYKKLCAYIEQIEQEIKDYTVQLDDFRLTTHSKSCSSLINVNKLKTYHHQHSPQHIDSIIINWRKIKNGTLTDLIIETNKERERELSGYRFINWECPFDFVEDKIDIEELAKELNRVAVPFVNSYTMREIGENQTTYTYYHNREKWKQEITDLKQIEMPRGTTTELSTHIESKFCMFHILQMDEMLIKGLTDLNSTPDE